MMVRGLFWLVLLQLFGLFMSFMAMKIEKAIIRKSTMFFMKLP